MDSPHTFILPTLHLNGTSREGLLKPLTAVIRQLQRAQDDLRECCPNARDYYPQGPAVFEAAVQQWQGFDRQLRSLTDSLDTIRCAIFDMPGRR